jgi:hypothetical protein
LKPVLAIKDNIFVLVATFKVEDYE